MQNEINTNKDYIAVLVQSLGKKIEVLNKILSLNEKQKEIISSENMNFDEFDEVYNEKEKLIKEISLLDSGFEKVYNRVKEILDSDRSAYRDEIKTMQELITQIVSKTADVEASEKRNYEAMSTQNAALKKKARTVKMTNKVAAGYYQTMNKLNYVEPQFMDKKK